MGPPGNWMTFEPIVRHAAGIGKTPDGPDPDAYESINRHCDVLVVGAGPAGLMAALSAARSGARVILAEETAEAGGQLLSLPEAGDGAMTIDDKTPRAWIADALAELAANDRVIILTRTAAAGYYADNFIALWEKVSDHLAPRDRDPLLPRQRLWRVRAKEVVLATGALERALVFNENDRPGIMLASAVRTYLHRYGALGGHCAAIIANNDAAWQTAFDLQAAGATISSISDSRHQPDDALLNKAAERDIPVRLAHQVASTGGRHRVKEITIESENGNIEGFDADLVAISGGWMPNVALFSQSRGQLRYDDHLAAFRPGWHWQRTHVCGQRRRRHDHGRMLFGRRPRGRLGGRGCRLHRQCRARAGACPISVREPTGISPIWQMVTSESGKKAFVDLQDDVKASDLELAVREGYRSVEHAKRYTTVGMATTRARSPISTPSASSPARKESPCRNSAPPPFASPGSRLTVRGDCRTVRRRRFRAAPHDPRCMTGTSVPRPSSSRSATGCAPEPIRARARPSRTPSSARRKPPAPTSPCSMPRRSARSTSRARTPAPSSTASTPTPGRSSPPGAAVTA